MSNQPGEGRREAARLEAFSDGVMAVIITIMAFGLKVPRDTKWRAAGQQLPSPLIYLLKPQSAVLAFIHSRRHQVGRTGPPGTAPSWRQPDTPPATNRPQEVQVARSLV